MWQPAVIISNADLRPLALRPCFSTGLPLFIYSIFRVFENVNTVLPTNYYKYYFFVNYIFFFR